MFQSRKGFENPLRESFQGVIIKAPRGGRDRDMRKQRLIADEVWAVALHIYVDTCMQPTNSHVHAGRALLAERKLVWKVHVPALEYSNSSMAHHVER